MPHVSSATTLATAAALSTHVDAIMAGEQACEEAAAALGTEKPDLVVLFIAGEHARHAEQIAAHVRRTLGPGTLLGVTSDTAVGGELELERQPAVSLLAATMPGTTLHPFAYRQMPHVGDNDRASLERMAEVIGAQRDLRGVLFFADPFSVPAGPVVESMSRCARTVQGLKKVPVFGGMASGGTAPGTNFMLLDDEPMRAGGAGVTIRGNISIDAVVSQGCRPIGKPLVITEGSRNVLRTLGGRNALEVLRDTVHELSEEDRALVQNGVFVGRVINEYKERFGRGDFLIRGIMGVDQGSGAVAVGDNVKVGQTVQFHLRDAKTASEDLKLLLDAQQLQHPPKGGLLFTCNGRGTRLFPERHHDAKTICHALSPRRDSVFPLAGCFAAGEIGPIGDSSFVHGHTAVLALLRPARRAE